MSTGLLHSAQSLLAGLVAVGRTRLELFSAELQEEIARQAAALLGALVLLALATLTLAFGAVALLLAVAEANRPLAASGIALVLALFAAAVAWALRRAARAKPRPFHASLEQLERDYEALKS